MHYFLAFGSWIRGFYHIKKVTVFDDTHLLGKYEGVLLSSVAQDMENHVCPISFYVMDKANDASWVFFFENLNDIMGVESYLCRICDRH